MVCLSIWYYFYHPDHYKSSEDLISSFRSSYYDMEEIYNTDAFLYERIQRFLPYKNEPRLFTSDGFGKEARHLSGDVYHFESHPVLRVR